MSKTKEMAQKNVKQNDETKDGINDLVTSDIFKVADLHFYRKNYIFRHLHDSYNKFLDEDVKNFLENEEHVFTENMTLTTFYRYKFKFDNIRIQEPMLDNGIEPLFPSAARHNNLTYSVKVFADVTQYQDIIDIASDEKITKKNGIMEENVLVAIIPLMVRSKYCTLTTNKGIDKDECDYDPGGYFLVKGNEKVVICQDRMIENKPLVFMKKDSGLYIQVNSRSYNDKGIIQPVSIRLKRDNELLIKVPILNEVNVVILLKALGMELDRNIINYITYDEYDNDMIDILRVSLENCQNDKGVKISNQEDALDYLVSKMKIMSKKITEGDKDVKHLQKRKFVINSLTNNLLPHVDETNISRMMNKAYYICYMINKLVRAHLGRIPLDDRDSYINKRVDLPGDLMYELYKQQHKKMLGDCKKYFDHRNKGHNDPTVIINILKPNIIEQGINAALSTGHWLRKQGVAQIVQRLTYLYTISLLRRIDSPGVGESTMKMTTPRHLHPSSAGFLCCVTGDTEILMADGTIRQIKDMKNGDEIVTIYKDNLKETTSEIKNFFSKENEKIYELTTMSGRKLKCTGDHPILIKNGNSYEMIDAERISFGDLVVIKPESFDVEYKNYCDRNNNQCGTAEIMSQECFINEFKLNESLMVSNITDVVVLPPETVYDFTTVLDSHTLIANGFVTSNCIETPEHAKIGLTKHLSLIGSITIMSREQYYLLSDYLSKRVIRIVDLPPEKLRNPNIYKVLLNGDWIGLTDDPVKLSDEMNKKRSEGYFNIQNTSIVRDDDENEIRVYCDSGRLYRPVLRVADNIVQLKKSHINEISLNKNDKNKITSWDEFMIKHPDLVDYIDTESQPYVMVAYKMKKVEEMRKRMNESVERIKDIKSAHVENRYDDMMYVKYNFCELHPSLLIGEIITNAPFCNMNAGQRNIFQYAQGRQAMTIYATNYRSRLDISYILYKPQRSLVYTRSSIYTNTRLLPPGENCLVAIGCYTGYNQEDSLIFNRTSIQRGKFRAMSVKKYLMQVQKNQSTAQDDILTKPDPTKVSGMKHGSYDKLNDKGYVEEEVTIEYGDIIFGKITPVSDSTGTGKPYRDTSEIYKVGAPGVIDRVYLDTSNQDGYEIRKCCVRSERVPKIGDKYCSCHGQKGTIGILMDDIDMPFNNHGLKPDIIVNPHAIPSRMTVGQLAECLVGKTAALQGMDADGTQFEEYDFTSVEKMLKELGYDEKGHEYLTNGMTGEKMLVKYFFGPTYYQRLKHLVHDKIHCLKMDHEVLTENGWKFFHDIKDGEKVATLKDGKLVYEAPTKLLHFPNYKGKMYKIETSQISLDVTDNHRMWVSSPHNDEYKHVMAKDLVGKFIKYKKDAEWESVDYQFKLEKIICDNNFVYEEKVVDMDAWLTFFGIWIGDEFASIIQDESTDKKSYQYRAEVSVNKQIVKDTLYSVLRKLGYDFNVYDEKITFCNKQLCMYLKLLSNGATDKYLPDWTWKLSKNQSKKLIDALILGDGSFNENSIRYYTSSKKLRDDIMRLSLHAGLSANYSLKEKAGTKTIISDDCIKTCDYYCIDINQTQNNPTANKKYDEKTTDDNHEQVYDYEGPVFCLEVPSEVFYVRREGLPVWTGNSRARGLKASLTRQKALQQGYCRRVTGRRGLARVRF